ncbi:MAG: hypothetical protein IK018_02850 [Lachnospiraceae bacterium]|nr:hypothetical protein [Lachnospiraceae bacterium]
MNKISNSIPGQLRTYEAYRAKKDTTEKNIVDEEEAQKGQRVDSVQFSKEGLAALEESLSSRTKGVKITKSGNDYNVLFKNPAYAFRAVKNGYIDIGGEKFTFSDDEKEELKKAAEDSFNQMQKDTLMATAEHNAHVLQQQAEALRDAGKEERDFLEMLLENLDDDRAKGKDDEEWRSPLLDLETHSVSMDLEKTESGFSLKAINTTVGYTFE